jgi:hypothetical protein
MKAKISAGWAHDTSHFQFLRQTPAQQARIPFVADAERGEFRDALIGVAVLAAFVGVLATMPWWLP